MTLTSLPIIGIALAVLSAALLTVGTFLQSRGVSDRQGEGSGLSALQVLSLARSPRWLIGSVLFGLAILAQMAALVFAPLMVVQPVGVVALVFAALLTAIVARAWPRRREIIAITVCVVSLAVFVAVAAAVTTQSTITSGQLLAMLLVLVVVLVLTGVLFLARRHRRLPPVVYVLLGGAFAGFVATLGKTVILRVQTALTHPEAGLDEANILTIACVLGIAAAGGLSIFFVQTAHTVNTPQVVVGGLTVVDPTVAVVLGIAVLGEAVGAPPWAFVVFAVAGAGAVWGVWSLAGESET